MEVEVFAELEGETDVEIDFSKLSPDEIAKIQRAISLGDKYTFKNVAVSLEGDTYVEIEPMDYH